MFSKTQQIAPFLKNFSGEHALEPPSKRVATHCMALRAMQIPTLFKKKIEHPPPPRNEILDTPLLRHNTFMHIDLWRSSTSLFKLW